MTDSKLWKEAYGAFKLTNPSSYSSTPKALRKQKRKQKKGKIANIKFNTKATPESITETTKEFYRWKKTEGCAKWKKSRFLKQGGLCFYCEDWLPLTRVNIEHIIPRSKGGSNKPENLVLSCSNCNKDKGATTLSHKRILELKARSKKHKGTYLKNKEHFDNLYGQYTDKSFVEMAKNL